MQLFHRIAVAAAAAALALTGLTVQTANAAETDPYSAPGGHSTGGRLWKTTCEKYSSDVVRCRTDIHATVVVQRGGRYVNDTGWHFNNLTYLPSPRARWAANPLGRTGTFTSHGRQWRTECDTAATGNGACRSYILTSYVAREGGRYVTKRGYVFNNMVRFAQGGIAPVTTVPAHVLDQSTLDFDGFGPIKLDMRGRDLGLLGYMDRHTLSECAPMWDPNGVVKSRGVDISSTSDTGKAWYVSLTDATSATTDGARVGMTIGQIKAIYGSEYREVRKHNYGEDQSFGSVRSGGRELMFRVDGPGDTYAPTRALRDTDVVAEIRAWNFADDVSFDGC